MRSGGVRCLIVQPDCQLRVQAYEGGVDLIGRAEYTPILGQLELDISLNNVIPTDQLSSHTQGTHRKSPPRASIT